MKVDGKAVKVVEKGKPAHFEIDFIDRTLPTNGKLYKLITHGLTYSECRLILKYLVLIMLKPSF